MLQEDIAGSVPKTRALDTGLPLARSLRILIVDDNLINQKVATMLLERNGHQVVVAGDGRQALDLLERWTFDLVLMDLQMPIMDGYEATAAIRRRDGTGWRMPVIAVTANVLEGDRQRCLDAGFDDYVAKPIRWPVLKAAIDNHFGQATGLDDTETSRPGHPPTAPPPLPS